MHWGKGTHSPPSPDRTEMCLQAKWPGCLEWAAGDGADTCVLCGFHLRTSQAHSLIDGIFLSAASGGSSLLLAHTEHMCTYSPGWCLNECIVWLRLFSVSPPLLRGPFP
jgi:hypothetical protein